MMMGFMIPSDSPVSQKLNFDIDLEIVPNAIVSEKGGSNNDFTIVEKASNPQITIHNDFSSPSNDQQVLSLSRDFSRADDKPPENRKSSGECCIFVEERMKFLGTKIGKEISGERALRKFSKPPRPPKSLPLDSVGRKVAREMSELAALKRLRAERMKSSRDIKNANTVCSGSNFCALFVTVLFCVIIILHGMSWKGLSFVKVDVSPESSQ